MRVAQHTLPLLLCRWMTSVRNVLREKPQFVDTGESLPGKGSLPQRVWRLDEAVTKPEQQ